ncbi:hypothetical protein [Phenylobacterium sp.]|uniref:hypothetical protein n=1 Tax=Phenylobacterium sp. TaxID=1871053 RepID=UPI0011F8C7B4|nr:hypothetical protein [Phenylobacterium sp.]THD63000.1 MAG: hypothetical protein E8A49_06515 [Phenylobacterium sp.]
MTAVSQLKFKLTHYPVSSEKQARAEAMLGEVAELALAMARELAVRARASEDLDETLALTEAFQKTTRVLRLTLALDVKLERAAARDAKDAAREAEAAAARVETIAAMASALPVRDDVWRRKGRVKNLLNRLLWTESEGDEEDFEVLTDDLAARLDEAALSPDFEALPIEVLARRMIADMGLSGAVTLSLCEPPLQDAGGSPPPLADTG